MSVKSNQRSYRRGFSRFLLSQERQRDFQIVNRLWRSSEGRFRERRVFLKPLRGLALSPKQAPVGDGSQV